MKHEILYLTRNDTSTHLIRAINFTFYEKLFRLDLKFYLFSQTENTWAFLSCFI